jgi:hypothetical protein
MKSEMRVRKTSLNGCPGDKGKPCKLARAAWLAAKMEPLSSRANNPTLSVCKNSLRLWKATTILATDKAHAAHNKALFNGWMKKHADLAAEAANGLQPLWSQPRVKVVSFADAQAQAKNRLEAICSEVGLAVP